MAVEKTVGLLVSEAGKDFQAPARTGVYIMKDIAGNVLYVGKALNLRSRVNQYLKLQDSRAVIPRLVRQLADIEYILTNSEKEALLLESQLVKKLKPRFNVMLRDDKQFLLIRVDFQEDFPRFDFVRRKKKDGADYFGPVPGAKILREFIRFLARAYRIRTCSNNQFRQRQRACVLHQLGWCTAPCVFPELNFDYKDRVRIAADLLSKKRQDAIALLEQAMMDASDEQRYEEAGRYRDLLHNLNRIWGKQHVRVRTDLNADVFGSHPGPLGGAVLVLNVRDSAVIGRHSFFNEGLFLPDALDIDSLIVRYYERLPPPPQVICDLRPDAARLLEQFLTEEHGRKVKVLVPVRGEKRALLDMAHTNARQAYTQESEKAQSRLELLEGLASNLFLPAVPEVVECVDISSFQGGDAVGSVAVSRDAGLAKGEYRCFHIKGESISDFEMMREVVGRRLKQVKNSGDVRLILVDGGRAHLSQVLPLAEGTRDTVFLAAIAKARPEQGLAEERVYTPGSREAVPLDPDSRIMHFISNLRDEAHRFGIAFHRKTRAKRVLSSPLLSIEGVGKKRRHDLIKHFGSYDALKRATLDEIKVARGFSSGMAQRVFDFLRSQD